MANHPCGGPSGADFLTLVDLQRCGEQAREAWRSSADSHVPLPLAAVALARVVAVYAIGENSTLAVIDIDLGSGRFRDGAALYERRLGHRITSLVVARAQLAPALDFIRTTGLPCLIADTVR